MPVPFSNSLKKKLAQGATCFGAVMRLHSTEIVEMAGIAGCDYVVVDAEHEPFTVREAAELVQTTLLCGMTPIVRLGRSSMHMIDPMLSAGAQGFNLARVKTAADVRELTDALYYYPHGTRTVYALGRSGRFGFETEEDSWMKEVNAELLVGVIIEESEAIDNLEAILAEPLLDFVDCGAKDLRQSMNMPPMSDVKAIEASVFARAKAAGKFTGHSVQGHLPDEAVYRSFAKGGGVMLNATPSGIIMSALAAQAALARTISAKQEKAA